MNFFIKNVLKKHNLDQFAVVKYSDSTFLAILFPYYVNSDEGNISLYARSADYHKIVKSYLLDISETLGEKFSVLKCYCDDNHLHEKHIAMLGGLGFIGKNQLLINKKYGSFCFIGIIEVENIEEYVFKIDYNCGNCNNCINACPTNVLSGEFIYDNCISSITQKKGDLTAYEQDMVQKTKFRWGCDICQLVCPYNKDIAKTPIPEFHNNIMLNLPDVSNLTDEQFSDLYGDRAFAWRGKRVVKRNEELGMRNEE